MLLSRGHGTRIKCNVGLVIAIHKAIRLREITLILSTYYKCQNPRGHAYNSREVSSGSYINTRTYYYLV